MRPRVKIEVERGSVMDQVMDGRIIAESPEVSVTMWFDWDGARDAINTWDQVSAEVRDQIARLLPAGEAERKRAQGDLR